MAKKEWSDKERRKFPRVNGKVPVTYRKLSNLSTTHFDMLKQEISKENVTRDFSRSGVCIKTDEKIAADTILEITLLFPVRKVKAIGRVVWSKQLEGKGTFCAGIEYVAIADKQVNEMVQSIAEFMIKQYELKEKKNINKLKDLFVKFLSREK